MRSLAKLRRDALSIFTAAVKSADPGAAIRRVVHRDNETLGVAGRRDDFSPKSKLFLGGGG